MKKYNQRCMKIVTDIERYFTSNCKRKINIACEMY